MTDFIIHPAIKEHLRRQGLKTDSDQRKFLFPRLHDLPSPFLMKDMEKAAELTINAMEQNHDIIVWGDYDVDGITATSLLVLFFKKFGISVFHHIPTRGKEGYGLNRKKIYEINKISSKKKLLITVDCGISNKEEVEYAKKLGFTVIITDHHSVPQFLAPADAILNPHQKGCDFPFKGLAGVGVAFYFASAIRSVARSSIRLKSYIKTINMKLFLGLVSLGTIADIMPLQGVNRILVKAGFEAIASSSCHLGLKKLFKETGVDRKIITSEHIAFKLAPVINAGGRMEKPIVALNVFISDQNDDFCKKLISLNKKRKKLSAEELEKALDIINKNLLKRANSIVINGSFSDGIIGITAARIVEIFRLPAIVLCQDPNNTEMLKGSARAPDGFNIIGAIHLCSRFLVKYGGHKAAAGLSIPKANLDLFSEAFDNSCFLELMKDKDNQIKTQPEYINLDVSESLNSQLTRCLLQLEPVGEENLKPLFIDNNCEFVSKSFFGVNKEHLRGILRGKYNNIPIIGFSMAEKILNIGEGTPCTVVYSHMLDSYNGHTSWKIRIHDAWPNSQR